MEAALGEKSKDAQENRMPLDHRMSLGSREPSPPRQGASLLPSQRAKMKGRDTVPAWLLSRGHCVR